VARDDPDDPDDSTPEMRAKEQKLIARYERKTRWALVCRNTCLFVAAVVTAKIIWALV
jgi:hypothetical protein